jgi:phage/plasmid-associated DNA primase
VRQTSEYREDSDPIGAFIRAACIVTGQEHDSATPDDICISYANWASREGQPEFKKSTLMRRFPDYARKQWEGPDGLMRAFRKHKSSTTRYVGITVREEYLRPRGADSSHRRGWLWRPVSLWIPHPSQRGGAFSRRQSLVSREAGGQRGRVAEIFPACLPSKGFGISMTCAAREDREVKCGARVCACLFKGSG